VYAASDEYLAVHSDEDLNRPLDLAALGLGESTVGYVLNNGVLGHGVHALRGDLLSEGVEGRSRLPQVRPAPLFVRVFA